MFEKSSNPVKRRPVREIYNFHTPAENSRRKKTKTINIRGSVLAIDNSRRLPTWKQALSYSKARATVRKGYWRSSCVRAKNALKWILPNDSDPSSKLHAIELIKTKQTLTL